MPLSNQIFPWVSAAPELKYSLFYVRSTKSGLYCVFNVSMLLHVFLFHFLTETFLLLRGERYSLVIAQPSIKLFSSSFSFPFSITCRPTERKAAFFLVLIPLAFWLPPQAPTPWPSSAAPCPPVVQVPSLPAAAPSAYLLQAWGSVEPLLRCFRPSWSERELLPGHEALLPLEWARQRRQGSRWWWWWWWWGQSSLCLGSSSLKLLTENIPHLVLWAACYGSRLTMRCGSSHSRITW